MSDPREARARTRRLVHEGVERTYRLHVPGSDTSGTGTTAGTDTPRPLVVLLHGGNGTGTGMARQGDWDRLARAEGFVTVAPDGIGRVWNAGTCCGRSVRDDVDDAGFVLAAIAQVAAEHPIDPARVYATGISNGGMMAYRLACEWPGRFAAIAPVAATMMWPAGPQAPVSLLHVHGLRDDFIPFEGGLPRRTAQRTPPSYPPVRDVVGRFVAVAGGPLPPEVRTEGEVVTTTWAPGPTGAAVELVTIAEGMHSWPGGRRMQRTLDPPSAAFDATGAIWRFFAAHPQAAHPQGGGPAQARI